MFHPRKEARLTSGLQRLWKTEDYWAIWLRLGIVLLTLAVCLGGSTIDGWAVTAGKWSTAAEFGTNFASPASGHVTIFVLSRSSGQTSAR